ncbi:MAG: BCCT family transporter [Candidatus Latescibacterota bacterium]|nr:BCCT family transporter [Candidatus Latescibacterota bacterium]
MSHSDRTTKWSINPFVFWASAGLTVGFVLLSVLNLQQMTEVFDGVLGFLTARMGWFFVLCVNVYLVVVLFLLLSRHGRIRLGGDSARPDFSTWGWLAMLFSAGMGIGLMFWSVAEPIYHFTSPPWGEAGTPEAAKLAMGITLFHWGFHAWGLYGLMALALAYFAYNQGLPLTVRSTFYPLLGAKIHGRWGDVIDTLATLATLFGLATSLGLGAQQVNAGMSHLFGLPHSVTVQVVLIALITAMAMTSVVLGVDRGIRRLSQLNVMIAGLLLLFVLITGPTRYLLDALVQNMGIYLRMLPRLGFWTEAYRETQWQHGWTIFYWAWWIAWAPFVGLFVARVSRGRTVREFLAAILLVPTMATFVWLTVFGNSALHVELFGAGGIAAAVKDNVAVALFVLLEQYPLSAITCGLAVCIVVTFFVTSSDSASLVVDIITAGGDPDPPKKQRVFWASMEGIVAAVLLMGGGLLALQTAVVVTGLPFALVLLLLSVSLIRGLETRTPSPPASPDRP